MNDVTLNQSSSIYNSMSSKSDNIILFNSNIGNELGNRKIEYYRMCYVSYYNSHAYKNQFDFHLCLISNFLLYLLGINQNNITFFSLGSLQLIKFIHLTLRIPYVMKFEKDVCRQSVSSLFFIAYVFFSSFNYRIQSSIFIRHVVDDDTIDARTEIIFDGDPDSLCLQE